MAVMLVSGAQLTCPFGSAPATLNKAPDTVQGCQKALLCISDLTIPPFGTCASLANPQVAAATAAAMGVLTPQPCQCIPAGPWNPGQGKILVKGKPVLTSDATLICGNGMGTITVINPGQTKILNG